MENRYSRHYLIKEWDETKQKNLKKSRVLVAGAGGLGSPLLMYLTSAGIGKITVVDHDKVSESNLNRQILYTENDIDSFKLDSAQRKLNQLNGNTEITAIKQKIEDVDREIISNHDLLIDCLDNFQSRFHLNKMSVICKIPMLHAGVSEFQGQITLFKPGETACLNCILNNGHDTSGKGILGSVAGIAGSIQATEAIKYLSSYETSLKNRILFFDSKKFTFNFITITKNENCDVCSSG